MKKLTLLHRAMVVNRLFSYSKLERQAGLSRSFIFRNLKGYENAGLVKRAGLGSSNEKLFRLTQAGKQQFDPKASMHLMGQTRSKLKPSKNDLTYNKLLNQPEVVIWKEIRRLKKFLASDLVKLEITSKTRVYQYLALLVRAGFLKKERANTVNNQCNYTLVQNTGDAAPVVGRAWFLFDPNSGKTWDDIPEREILKTGKRE